MTRKIFNGISNKSTDALKPHKVNGNCWGKLYGSKQCLRCFMCVGMEFLGLAEEGGGCWILKVCSELIEIRKLPQNKENYKKHNYFFGFCRKTSLKS